MLNINLMAFVSVGLHLNRKGNQYNLPTVAKNYVELNPIFRVLKRGASEEGLAFTASSK